MQQSKLIVAVLLGLFAVACSATPETEGERVDTREDAIRDPLSTMCWYVECDSDGVPISPPGGAGGGGMGGSGEGGASEGGGGGHGGGGAGGGGGGAGEGGRWEADASDFARCNAACAGGAPAIAAFCGSIPVPQVQAICYANQFAGTVICEGFCLAWFVAG